MSHNLIRQADQGLRHRSPPPRPAMSRWRLPTLPLTTSMKVLERYKTPNGEYPRKITSQTSQNRGIYTTINVWTLTQFWAPLPQKARRRTQSSASWARPQSPITSPPSGIPVTEVNTNWRIEMWWVEYSWVPLMSGCLRRTSPAVAPLWRLQSCSADDFSTNIRVAQWTPREKHVLMSV